ncbi:hypothetical protein L195_g054553, partial [Trifolium pratense]
MPQDRVSPPAACRRSSSAGYLCSFSYCVFRRRWLLQCSGFVEVLSLGRPYQAWVCLVGFGCEIRLGQFSELGSFICLGEITGTFCCFCCLVWGGDG